MLHHYLLLGRDLLAIFGGCVILDWLLKKPAPAWVEKVLGGFHDFRNGPFGS